jgi:hypothetical protein
VINDARWHGVRGPRRVVADRDALLLLELVCNPDLEQIRAHGPAHDPDRDRAEHDERERHVHHEDRDERRDRHAEHESVHERLGADADGGRRHDRDHRRGEPGEHRVDPRNVAMHREEPGQSEHDEHARQHEHHARDEPSPYAMQQPTQVDRELLRLRTRQQHAEVQRVQEAPVRHPRPTVHDLVVHEGDLPGRPSEVDEPELDPEARSLAERHVVLRLLLADHARILWGGEPVR